MSSTSRNLHELFARAAVTPFEGTQVPAIPISGLTDDSRAVGPGSCFVAVPGVRLNGAAFLDAAQEAGAGVVVTGPGVATPPGLPVVRVADPREALAHLAAAFYGLKGGLEHRPKLIGVTGTNGKTTVTWLLRSIFQAAGKKTALLGTVEYDLLSERIPAPLTTPGAVALCQSLSAARGAGAEYAVLEVSSHALDQRRCDGLTFAAGVFTNLTGDHLDYHGDMERYARAKRRLFEMLPGDAAAVLNADDARGREFAARCKGRVLWFGIESRRSAVRGEVQRSDRAGTRFVLHGCGGPMTVGLSLVGRHNVLNALAAAATAHALGFPAELIREGLEAVAGVPGRLQRVEPDGWPFSVLVDYAHTDDALRHVLTALRPVTQGRLICVFGCGGDRDKSKRPRMAEAVGELADIALVTSDNPRTEDPNDIIQEILAGFHRDGRCLVEVDADRRGAIAAAIHRAREGDTVLIAGKGHENYQLVGSQVLSFDDVQVAREALGNHGFRPAGCRERASQT